MKGTRFSIIFAVVRPEISERLSVGVIIFDDKGVDIRYSQKKLDALEGIFTKGEHRFISNVVTSLKKNGKIDSEEAVNYLTRYSNNLITVSPIQSIDIEPTENVKNKIYQNYVK